MQIFALALYRTIAIIWFVLEVTGCHLGGFDRWVGWSLVAGGHLVAGLDRWVGWLSGRTGLGRWALSWTCNLDPRLGVPADRCGDFASAK